MTNKDTYQSQKIVKRYANLDELFKAERTILGILKNKLKNMRMLDIGVGGGRTTYYFSPLVKEYLGIDYSEQMINACEKRFPNHPDKISCRYCCCCCTAKTYFLLRAFFLRHRNTARSHRTILTATAFRSDRTRLHIRSSVKDSITTVLLRLFVQFERRAIYTNWFIFRHKIILH